MIIKKNKHIVNMIDDAIDRACQRCMLDEEYKKKLDQSADVVEELKTLGRRPKQLAITNESLQNQASYELLFEACFECISLGMGFQRMLDQLRSF